MRKYILISVFLSLLVVSCADSGSIVYDYKNEDTTLGLTVAPSNTLNFTADDIDKAKEFSLYIDTNTITLIGIDETSSDYGNGAFSNEPKFDNNTCFNSVGTGSPCIISIKMNSSATAGSSGYIKLKFIYNNDDKAESGYIKYHKLTFMYENK